MNPKIVGCLFASVAVGGICAGAAVAGGLGILPGLAIYSLVGSGTLVSGAILASREPRDPKPSANEVPARRNPAWA